MTRRKRHPIWTHLPSAIMLFIILADFIRMWPALTKESAVPFSFSLEGIPFLYGPVWQFALLVIFPICVLFIVSIFIDELWTRQETQKTFNWMALFDDLAIGAVAGVVIAYFYHLQRYSVDPNANWSTLPNFNVYAWPWAVGLALATVLFAVVLEWIRPYRSERDSIERLEIDTLEAHVSQWIFADGRWSYIETQEPSWLSPFIFLMSSLLMLSAIFCWEISFWASLLCFILSTVLFLFYGGLCVLITGNRLDVRLGFWGISLASTEIIDIAKAENYAISSGVEFVGYGIHRTREKGAFFFQGDHAVKIHTMQGKQYLIGSDNPERLMAVIFAAMSAVNKAAQPASSPAPFFVVGSVRLRCALGGTGNAPPGRSDRRARPGAAPRGLCGGTPVCGRGAAPAATLSRYRCAPRRGAPPVSGSRPV